MSEYKQAKELNDMVAAPAASTVVQIMYKSEDGILRCYGTDAVSVLNALPADTFAPSCLYQRVNGASSIVYINEAAAGSVSSFQELTGTAAAVTGIQELYQATLAADAGPSPLIWDNAPLFEVMLDPSKGFYYFNDYLGEIDITTTDGYVISNTNSGGITPVADEDGGVLLVDSQGFNANDDGVNVQLTNCMFKPVAGRKIYFEARVKMVDAGDDQYFIGLAGVDTLLIDTGVLDDTVDKAGFFRHAGSTADRISSVTARTSAKDATADVGVIANGTYVNLGFVIDGITSIKFYVNGALVETGVTGANIPNAVMCLSYVAQVEQNATDAELSVDWVRILQTGARS